MDRARRNGSSLHGPFNVWIMREAHLMAELITLIRSHLQAIKAACDLTQFGTQWPSEVANVAHALHYQRIPDAWCDAIGPTAPLPTWGLTNFFADLTLRAEHIEKVLTKGKSMLISRVGLKKGSISRSRQTSCLQFIRFFQSFILIRYLQTGSRSCHESI